MPVRFMEVRFRQHLIIFRRVDSGVNRQDARKSKYESCSSFGTMNIHRVSKCVAIDLTNYSQFS